MTLNLSMTCGPYDRARALIDGRVKPKGVTLDITVNHDDVDRQPRAARGEFDIYINKNSGIRKPSDLNGKRVVVQTWITSAALWAKGMLEEDHGVDLASIEWVAWQAVRIPDWKAPSWLKLVIAPEGSDQ